MASADLWERPAFKRQKDGDWYLTIPHLLIAATLLAAAVRLKIHEKLRSLSSQRAAKSA